MSVEPASGMMPRSVKGVRKSDCGVAKVRSQWNWIVVPMPIASPSTPASMGFFAPASASRKLLTSAPSSPLVE